MHSIAKLAAKARHYAYLAYLGVLPLPADGLTRSPKPRTSTGGAKVQAGSFTEMESQVEAPATAATKTQGHPNNKLVVSSGACPDLSLDSDNDTMTDYQSLVEGALGLPPGNGELLAIQIMPRFGQPRALHLLRNHDGTYRIRSMRLPENAWEEVMAEMKVELDYYVQLDRQQRSGVLARLRMLTSTKERRLEKHTAQILLALWQSLIARARESWTADIISVDAWGVDYRIWGRRGGARVNEPERGTVLKDAVVSAERLEELTADGATDEDSVLESARLEMQDALSRTRRKEPCTKTLIRPLDQESLPKQLQQSGSPP
jgi:hypothetical protein